VNTTKFCLSDIKVAASPKVKVKRILEVLFPEKTSPQRILEVLFPEKTSLQRILEVLTLEKRALIAGERSSAFWKYQPRKNACLSRASAPALTLAQFYLFLFLFFRGQ
jgi:hypothetical protein